MRDIINPFFGVYLPIFKANTQLQTTLSVNLGLDSKMVSVLSLVNISHYYRP